MDTEVTKEKTKSRSETQLLPYLPEEIVHPIVSRLPVESLHRFRCVSKHWLSFISHPNFSLSNPRHLVIVISNWVENRDQHSYSIHLIDHELSVKQLPIPESWPQNPQHGKKLSYDVLPKIRGSCNGLLLVSAGEKDLFLWNPLNRCCSRVLSHRRLRDYAIWGLCYDSLTDDYKAVVAFEYGPVLVGSFRNNTWTEINFPFSLKKFDSGPTVDGNPHWLVWEVVNEPRVFYLWQTRPDLIVYFDPCTNEFVKVPMPQPNQWQRKRNGYRVLGLGVLDGCLSLALGDHVRFFSCNFEVLAMKKYGDESSWTSLFRISNVTGLNPSDRLVPLCYSNKGEVLMQWNGDRMLVCNPKDKSYRDFLIRTSPCNIDAALLIETIVSPTCYSWEGGGLRGNLPFREEANYQGGRG